jgi:uncharacterized membrane protein YkvA (DUF1232 family)
MLENLKKRVRHLKSETYALYLAARHPQTPWYAKLFVAGVVAYALSPIDLIPDFVPVIGYLDDLILIPLGIVVAVKLIPPGVLAECRARAREAEASGTPVNRTAAVVIIGVWVLLAALCMLWAYEAFAMDGPRHQRELRAVAVAADHDPLFVDHASIERAGTQVNFRYVLNVPVALEAPAAARRWRSNEMEAVIDCAGRTYSIGNVIAHSGPAGTGSIVGRYSSTPAERRPAPIVGASTFDYLARHVCAATR